MVALYIKGLSKSVMNICGKVGIPVQFRGGNTIKSILVAPKDRDNIIQKSEVIYSYKCNRLDVMMSTQNSLQGYVGKG